MVPFLTVKPWTPTSAVQAVFGITLGSDVQWPEGTTVEHTFDGVTDTFAVPPDQYASVVYLVYHDTPLGQHDWSGMVTFPGEAPVSVLHPLHWEIVAPAPAPASAPSALSVTQA